jgi:hypothetical protein
MTNIVIRTPAQWDATPYGEHWSFAYNLANKEREEYDFTVEFHESIAEPEQKAVIILIEAAPVMLAALLLAQRALNSAPRFRVVDTDSYAIAAIVDDAVRTATLLND